MAMARVMTEEKRKERRREETRGDEARTDREEKEEWRRRGSGNTRHFLPSLFSHSNTHFIKKRDFKTYT
jgi:hypothetical protein